MFVNNQLDFASNFVTSMIIFEANFRGQIMPWKATIFACLQSFLHIHTFTNFFVDYKMNMNINTNSPKKRNYR